MINDIYNFTVAGLASFLGRSDDLSSGNGTRFKNSARATLTVYHANIATGNSVEIAIKAESIARTLGCSEGDALAQIHSVCAITSQPVKLNQQYKWPRVGIRNNDEASSVIRRLSELTG